MTQHLFIDRLSNPREFSGFSQEDFELVRKIAPKAQGWADEVAQFFFNMRSLTGRQPISKKTLISYYLSFFGIINNEELFWQEKTQFFIVFMPEGKSNEFLIGFSAMLIMTYGRKDGMKFAAAFERILKTGLFLQTETILN